MALAAMFVLGYVVAAALNVILRLWLNSPPSALSCRARNPAMVA